MRIAEWWKKMTQPMDFKKFLVFVVGALIVLNIIGTIQAKAAGCGDGVIDTAHSATRAHGTVSYGTVEIGSNFTLGNQTYDIVDVAYSNCDIEWSASVVTFHARLAATVNGELDCPANDLAFAADPGGELPVDLFADSMGASGNGIVMSASGPGGTVAYTAMSGGSDELLTSEECDDGGTTAGDGCDDVCVVEDGWSCVGQPSECTEQQTEPPIEEPTTTAGLSDEDTEKAVLVAIGYICFVMIPYFFHLRAAKKNKDGTII